MTGDFFDETFADLDAFYPNSKRKRREAPAPVEKLTSWEDDYFDKTLPNGNVVQMYTIGSLAKAINRPTKTVRFWIEQGHLPTSPYRLPDKVGKNGKVYAGRRLYSKAMVEAVVEAFISAGLFNTNRVEWSLHRSLVDKIAEAWDTIRTQELQINT